MEPAEPAQPAFPGPRAGRREAPREHPAARTGRHEAVRLQPQESPAPAAGQGIQPTTGRPSLPRRSRQAHLAPQLVSSQKQQQAAVPQPGERRRRSPEQARNLFDAIENGTRQARRARRDPGTNYTDGREG